LTPHKAAKWLRGFGIRPARTETYRGYERKAILAAANRYVPQQPSGATGSVSHNSRKHLRMTDADASDGYSTKNEADAAK
jgi:hypothetical protein